MYPRLLEYWPFLPVIVRTESKYCTAVVLASFVNTAAFAVMKEIGFRVYSIAVYPRFNGFILVLLPVANSPRFIHHVSNLDCLDRFIKLTLGFPEIGIVELLIILYLPFS